MDMKTAETAATAAKWATVLNHVRANRIEYLICIGILHLVGFTNKLYAQVEGVCI